MEGLVEDRIVHYVLREQDAKDINERRSINPAAMGWQIHKGNHASSGDHVPMIIVKVWPDEFGKDHSGVNGQCFLDGNDQFWVTSAKFDDSGEPGTWHWIEKA